jgi:hypothetical protein
MELLNTIWQNGNGYAYKVTAMAFDMTTANLVLTLTSLGGDPLGYTTPELLKANFTQAV